MTLYFGMQFLFVGLRDLIKMAFGRLTEIQEKSIHDWMKFNKMKCTKRHVFWRL